MPQNITSHDISPLASNTYRSMKKLASIIILLYNIILAPFAVVEIDRISTMGIDMSIMLFMAVPIMVSVVNVLLHFLPPTQPNND
jgi:hypothetical protein